MVLARRSATLALSLVALSGCEPRPLVLSAATWSDDGTAVMGAETSFVDREEGWWSPRPYAANQRTRLFVEQPPGQARTYVTEEFDGQVSFGGLRYLKAGGNYAFAELEWRGSLGGSWTRFFEFNLTTGTRQEIHPESERTRGACYPNVKPSRDGAHLAIMDACDSSCIVKLVQRASRQVVSEITVPSSFCTMTWQPDGWLLVLAGDSKLKLVPGTNRAETYFGDRYCSSDFPNLNLVTGESLSHNDRETTLTLSPGAPNPFPQCQ